MGCGIAIVKYLVFIFNLVFAFIGAALLVIGVLFKVDIAQIKASSDSFILAPTFLIAVGALIFIISFFGCCGAIKESNCMLITYAILLIVILVIQVAIGIFAFMTVNDNINIEKDMRDHIQDMFDKYNATQQDRNDFNDFQKSMKCCGVDGPADWKIQSLPESCCIDSHQSCSAMDDLNVYTTGCSKKGYQKVMLVLKSVGYVAFGICVAEIIGILFAFCLTNSMRNQYRRGTYA